MKKFIFLLFAVLCSSIIHAQTQVTGTVTAKDDGLPIPYATIQIKGSKSGGYTDENGKYSISVPKDAVLIFSSVGFVNVEIPVAGKSVINVVMDVDAVALEETIVVAYGTVKKGSYSGSASVVKENALKDAPVVSFEQVLSGKAAGVQVASSSGQPGSEVNIDIRGYGSFNAGNQPLYVIDGVPATSGDYSSGNISTSAMNFLNPSDVESITILKDAAAASLYGSRASNGVILITTKKGKAGKLTSTFKANVGLSYFAYDNYPLVSDSQAEALHRESWTNYANNNPSVWKKYSSVSDYVDAMVAKNYPAKDESKYIYKDWEDVLFRTGVAQTYEYSLSGGGEKGKIYASIAYTDQQGVVSIDYLRRFSTTINGETQIGKRLKIGGTVQYSWQYQDGHQDGQSSKDNPFYQWKVILNERWPYQYKDGSLYLEAFNPGLSTINPVASYDAQVNDARQNRLILKGWAEFKFTDWLTAKTIISSDWLYVHDRFGWLYGHPNFYAYSDVGGYMSDRHRNVNKMVSSSTLNFDRTWNKHHVSAMAGWESEKETYRLTRVGKIDFSYLGATESIMGANFDDGYSYSREVALLSFLSRVAYDYNNKYYLTGTYRRDGSSKLAPDTRWGDFWSVSGSWRFSNEKFMDFAWLNVAKLRGSYGTSGTLPSSSFDWLATYDYTFYGDKGASYPGKIANTDLTWEKNKNWNIGLDATIFDRYTLSVEYFNRKTTDLLLDASIPTTTGFGSTLMNIGAMRNDGWELSLSIDIIKKKDWDFSFGVNWSKVNNEILALSTEDEEISSTPHIWKQGYSFYQYYTRNYLGVCPEDNYMGNSRLKAGNPMYAEGSFYKKGETVNRDVYLKDGTVVEKGSVMPKDSYNYYPTNRNNSSSMILEGKTAIPKGYGGFNFDLRWKDLSFSMAWAYKYGHYIWDEGVEQMESDGYYSFHRNISTRQLNPWSETNKNSNVPKRIQDNNQGGYYYSSRFMKKGDYLRLKNLTVSYNVPKSFTTQLGISNARVYVAGSNLLTFSGLNIDPEVPSNGRYRYSMPALRTVSLGVEVSF